MTTTLGRRTVGGESSADPAEVHAQTSPRPDTVVPMTAARSAHTDPAVRQTTATEPLQLAVMLVEASRMAVGVTAAQAALADIFSLVSDHGYGSSVGVSRPGPNGAVTTMAANNELARVADRLQHQYREGPTVDTASATAPIECADLATGRRWPRWAPRVAALGVRSLVSVPLRSGAECLGVLTMYRAQPHPYAEHELAIAKLIGGHIAVVLEHLSATENAWKAVDARYRIGTALGVLMVQFGITSEQSFALLHRYSQHTNRKIRDIAADIIATRELSVGPPPPPS
ncbi:MAG: GAF and ANTAR domain-containing protein [Actinomycetota bacterium]|nr:GAF and ANTAR domain-containing protein [Actinomycetota bacterium]